MHNLLSIFLTGYLTITSTYCDRWRYSEEESNGILKNDEDWGGICSTGRRQSPVDLATDASIKGIYPGFIFHGYDKPMVNPYIVNNGHSIQIITKPGPITVSGGGLPGTYIFDQMHFHWASEHTINSGRYALELHMVHFEKRFETIDKASAEKNGIAVLGILFHVAVEPNPIIEKILQNAGNVFEAVNKNQTLQEEMLLSELFQNNKSSFFRYEGSLTTPNCGESVMWTVFESSVPISLDQVERFKSVQDDVGNLLTHNYRKTQPLNSRPLVYIKGFSENGTMAEQFSLTLTIVFAIISIVLLKY